MIIIVESTPYMFLCDLLEDYNTLLKLQLERVSKNLSPKTKAIQKKEKQLQTEMLYHKKLQAKDIKESLELESQNEKIEVQNIKMIEINGLTPFEEPEHFDSEIISNLKWFSDGYLLHRIEAIFERTSQYHIRLPITRIERLLRTSRGYLIEKQFRKLLMAFPQIIEPNLTYLNKEYRLGNSPYFGDILYNDTNSIKLNVEIKVYAPTRQRFFEQMERYVKYIPECERIMYIAPIIDAEKQQFCKDNNIEVKEIDINAILEW